MNEVGVEPTAQGQRLLVDLAEARFQFPGPVSDVPSTLVQKIKPPLPASTDAKHTHATHIPMRAFTHSHKLKTKSFG